MDHSPHSPPPARGALAAWWADLKTALAFLSRLPIPVESGPAESGGVLPRAARTFPLVGIAVGVIGAIVFAVAIGLSLPAPVAAALAVTATILATGAMHEDGLADTADGLGGGGDRDHKLSIMRDSRTGSYGALALILSVLLRVFALFLLAAPLIEQGLADEARSVVTGALVAAHAVSRAALPAVMWHETLARETGFAVAAGKPDQTTVLWSLGLGAVIALLCLGLGGAIVALLAAALATAVMVWLARQQIGGYTGDILGAVQQTVEIAVLLAALALQ